MKNIVKFLWIITVAVIIMTMFTSCGDNPKSLAKETINIVKQSIKADDNNAKKAELEQRWKVLGEKVENLSEKDQEIYHNEVERLAKAEGW